MKIGITGSVGFLGANLVKYLYDQGPQDLEVICYYGRRRSNPLTGHLELNQRHLDVTSRQEVVEKTRDLDVLFHLAGLVDFSRKHARRTWDVNVLGTKNIFDGAIRNGIGKIVYISSINVLGTVLDNSRLADETNEIYASPANPISFGNRENALAAVESSLHGDYGFMKKSRVPYFDSKLAAYELASDYHRLRRLPVVTVFPGTAVGPGDIGFSISRLIYLVFMGRLKVALPGRTSFVSARDAAQGIWLSYLRGKPGRSYIITGRQEDNLEYREFMKIVAKIAVRRHGRAISENIYTLPRSLCYLAANALRILAIDKQPSAELILSGCANHRFSHERARSELGYVPRVCLEDAVSACLEFHLRYAGGIES